MILHTYTKSNSRLENRASFFDCQVLVFDTDLRTSKNCTANLWVSQRRTRNRNYYSYIYLN